MKSIVRLTAMRIGQVIAGLLAALALANYANSEPAKPIGWVPDAYFEVVENASDTPEFHREFYPKGEGAAHWTERVVVTSRSAAPGTTPAGVLDELFKTETKRCAGVHDERLPVPDEYVSKLGMAMWHCPINKKTSRGEVAVQKVLLSTNRAFVITAQGDFAPFEPGNTPLLTEQLDRWLEFQNSFALCDSWTNAGCMPEATAIMTAGAAEMSTDESAAVQTAERRALEIYRQDQIAWHGTDFAREKKLIKATSGVFIAEAGEGRSGRLYFVSQDDKHPGWVRVDLDETGTASEGPHERSLPASVQTRLVALATARKAELKSCSDRLNTAVIADEAGDGWLVYFLSAAMEAGHIPLGGHTRVRVDKSGSRIINTEYSAKTCLAVDFNQVASQTKGAAITPIVTQLVSAVPWETHVFQSLTFGRDILVVTKHAVWRVGKGKITKLKVD
jgi:hypothetical protein